MSAPGAVNGAKPQDAPGASSDSPLQALIAERPEIAVGAAFLGGLIVAKILRRLGS